METKILDSYHAIAKAPLGTRVLDANGHTARRVTGGWRYEASAAAGLVPAWHMPNYAPLQVLERVPDEQNPPTPPIAPAVLAGRLHWDAEHTSPWVQFRTMTEYRSWAADIRRVRPGTRTEYTWVGWVHSAGSLLQSAQHAAGLGIQDVPETLPGC